MSAASGEMHELSIALSIIEGVEQEMAARAGDRVATVHVRLGPLSGVVGEALASAYEMACAGSGLEGSVLAIEEIPIGIYCPRCARETRAVSLQRMACVDCGTLSSDVRSGAELEVFALELCE